MKDQGLSGQPTHFPSSDQGGGTLIAHATMFRKVLYLLIFIVIPSEKAWAIPQFPWGPSGVIISTATGNEDFGLQSLVRSDSTTTLVAWQSQGTIFAQRVADDQTRLWASTGVSVAPTTGATFGPAVVSDGSGGMLIVWQEEDDVVISTLMVQGIDQNGNKRFGNLGLFVSTGADDSQVLQWVIPDGANGGIIDFDCAQTTGILCVQRFNNSGDRLWGDTGVEITTTAVFGRGMPVSDGANGVVIAWVDKRNNDSSNRDIFIQRVNAAGTELWGTDGVPVETTSGNGYSPTMGADGAGGVFIAWTDDRTGNRDVYAQRIDSNGNPMWTINGAPIVSSAGDQFVLGFKLIPDGSGGVYIFWQTGSTGNEDIYAQRLNSSGQIQWGANGVPIATSIGRDLSKAIESDGDGGVVLRWSRINPDGTGQSLIQRINSQGQRLWGTDGLEIIPGGGREVIAKSSTTFFFTGRVIDATTGRDLFLQRVDDTAGPEPPSNLIATALAGQEIRLNWTESPTTNVAHYNIYYDSGTGVIDYSVRLSSVAASSTTFTADALIADVTYKFGLRTVDDNGMEELNTDVVASAAALESLSTSVQAAIKVPKSGMKITGNRTLVMAEIVQGSLANVKNVRFQYRNAISTTNPWLDITAATVQHPNPDGGSPYFVHCDVSAFAEGVYELRAVATNGANVADPSPPTIFITIDHADPDSEEIVSGGGLRKREKVNNSIANTVRVGDPTRSVLTNVSIPATALSDSTTTLRVLTVPSAAPAVPGDFASSDIFTEITLENGQTTLSNSQLATLTLTYPDSNNDGIVDVGGVREESLALYRFNTGANRWDKLPSSIDTGNNTVTAQTPGFSVFGLFAPAAADLSDVLVYPVPWVPNDGDDNNGKPFSSGDAASGIIFENVTQGIKIEVFTVTGELVWKHSTDASSNKVRWNARNQSGRDVASGGYFAVITDKGSGTKVVRKLAVIR